MQNAFKSHHKHELSNTTFGYRAHYDVDGRTVIWRATVDRPGGAIDFFGEITMVDGSGPFDAETIVQAEVNARIDRM